MLQQEQAEDYRHRHRRAIQRARIRHHGCGMSGHPPDWKGTGVDEKAYDQRGKSIVAVDPRYFRPAEVETLLGDASKARKELGWSPKTDFRSLVEEMVTEDLKAAERDALVTQHGYAAYNFHES